MKKVTPKEYAAMRKPPITSMAVCKAIRNGHQLPGVKEIERYGRFYLLKLTKKFIIENQLVTEDKK